MTPVNPLYAIIVFLIAYATGYFIPLKYKPKIETRKYETIDGFRGFHPSRLCLVLLSSRRFLA
jgi:hypothetical protein